MLPRGIIVSIPIPFDDKGPVDISSLQNIIRALVEQHAEGLLVFPNDDPDVVALSMDERQQILDCICLNCEEIPLIVGLPSIEKANDVKVVLDSLLTTHLNSRQIVGVSMSLPLSTSLDDRAAILKAVTEHCHLPILLHDHDRSHPLSLDALRSLQNVLSPPPPPSSSSASSSSPIGGVIINNNHFPMTKFSMLRDEFGPDFWLGMGECEAMHLMEGLERSVDGVVVGPALHLPFRRIDYDYFHGRKRGVETIFPRCLPILTYISQSPTHGVIFNKRALYHQHLVVNSRLRPLPAPAPDDDELRTKLSDKWSQEHGRTLVKLSDSVLEEVQKDEQNEKEEQNRRQTTIANNPTRLGGFMMMNAENAQQIAKMLMASTGPVAAGQGPNGAPTPALGAVSGQRNENVIQGTPASGNMNVAREEEENDEENLGKDLD